MKFETQNKLLSTFSYSSLTDIVMLLLIFFLLSSSFIIQPGIKVQLPKSDVSETSNQKSVSITITKDNVVYLNEDEVALTELPAKWSQLIVLDPNQVTLLRADKGVTMDKFVEVMDIGMKVGAKNFNIVTEKKSQ